MNEDVGEIVTGPADSGITEFGTYEEYLDSQITPNDLFYLEVWMLRFISDETNYMIYI